MRHLPLAITILGATALLASGACGSGTTTTGGSGGISGNGGSGGSGGSGGGAVSPIEDAYCRPYAELFCTNAADCGCFAPFTSTPISEPGCVEKLTATCVSNYSEKMKRVSAGALQLDTGAAGTCVQNLSRVGKCERVDAFCQPFFLEPVAEGQKCIDVSDSCADGKGTCFTGTCALLPATQGAPCAEAGCLGDFTCLSRVCTPPVQPGSTCSGDLSCQAPLHCVEGVCGPLRKEGSQCLRDTSCSLGLVCQGNSCQPPPAGTCGGGIPCGNLAYCSPIHTCNDARAENAPCVADAECASGLLCINNNCGLPPRNGQNCIRGTVCGAGYVCDKKMMGKCIIAPTRGQDCYWEPAGKYACGTGLVCVKGKCNYAPDRGSSCSDDGTCGLGLVCRRAAGVCASPVDLGGACTVGGGDCGADARCAEGGFCVALSDAGGRCTVPADCKAGQDCAADSSGLFVCSPLPGHGQTCGYVCSQPGDRCEQQTAAGCQDLVCSQLPTL